MQGSRRRAGSSGGKETKEKMNNRRRDELDPNFRFGSDHRSF